MMDELKQAFGKSFLAVLELTCCTLQLMPKEQRLEFAHYVMGKLRRTVDEIDVEIKENT